VQLATVGLDEHLGYGQTEAGSTVLARARLVGAVKPIEDTRQVFRRDSRTRVGHL
jgi:hypothetical protein